MNKTELVEAIADDAGVAKSVAKDTLEAATQAITRALRDDDAVGLPGFGTFSVRARAARSGRNADLRTDLRRGNAPTFDKSLVKGLLLSALIAVNVPAHPEVVMSRDHARDVVLPECETPNAPDDCPSVRHVQGFKVLVSSTFPVPFHSAVSEWFRMAEATLYDLERRKGISPYFVDSLRRGGVSFYLHPGATTPPGKYEPFEYDRHRPHPDFWAASYYTNRRVVLGVHMGNAFATYEHHKNVMVHEIAHAYHDIVVADGFGNACVDAAYNASVVDGGLHDGHYISNNPHEYFAETLMYVLGESRVQEGLYKPDLDGEGTGTWLWPNTDSFSEDRRQNYGMRTRDRWALFKYDRNAVGMFESLAGSHVDKRADVDCYGWWPGPLGSE